MHFCQNDSPVDNVDRVRDVLEFLTEGFCAQAAAEVTLSTSACHGLMVILMACEGTLARAQPQEKPNPPS